VVFAGKTDDVEEYVIEGSEILARGQMNYYAEGGKLSYVVEEAILLGDGAYSKLLEEVEDELATAGIFDEEHKKSVPQFPTSIGLLTSAQGDAIKDLRNSLSDERIGANLYLYDITVQGEDTIDKLEQGLEILDQRDLDAIVITRGGGATRQFRPFNAEGVVKAIYQTETPVISALGHQADRTLTDRVADEVVMTPTDTSSAFKSHSQMIEWIERNRDDLKMAYQDSVSREVDGLLTDLSGAVSTRQERFHQIRHDLKLLRRRLQTKYSSYTNGEIQELRTALSKSVTARHNKFEQQRQRLVSLEDRVNSGYVYSAGSSINQLQNRLSEAASTRVSILNSHLEWRNQSQAQLKHRYEQELNTQIADLDRELEQAFEDRKTINQQKKQEKRFRTLLILLAILVIGILLLAGALFGILPF
jgi:exodeoxyribonuclease VII large subunit